MAPIRNQSNTQNNVPTPNKDPLVKKRIISPMGMLVYIELFHSRINAFYFSCDKRKANSFGRI